MYIRSIIAIVGSLMLSGYAQATIINGDFSSSTSLDGWSFLGNVSEADPADPNERAILDTAGGSTNTSAINSALGIDIDAVTSGFTGGGSFGNGSFLYQSFTVAGTGDLSIDWNFLSNEGGLGSQPDFAFSVLTGMGEHLLAQWPGDVTGTGQSGFSQSSGFNTETLSGLAAGTYTLGFGVVNVNGTSKQSGLLIDNVVLTDTTVPVPTTVALLGLGLIGLRRRMR